MHPQASCSVPCLRRSYHARLRAKSVGGSLLPKRRVWDILRPPKAVERTYGPQYAVPSVPPSVLPFSFLLRSFSSFYHCIPLLSSHDFTSCVARKQGYKSACSGSENTSKRNKKKHSSPGARLLYRHVERRLPSLSKIGYHYGPFDRACRDKPVHIHGDNRLEYDRTEKLTMSYLLNQN